MSKANDWKCVPPESVRSVYQRLRESGVFERSTLERYFISRYMLERVRVMQAEAKIKSLTKHMRRLEKKISALKREIARSEQVHIKRRTQLDALYYVWCDGGCVGGVRRYVPSACTKDIVTEAVRNTARLVRWYNNRELRMIPIQDRFDYLEIVKQRGGVPPSVAQAWDAIERWLRENHDTDPVADAMQTLGDWMHAAREAHGQEAAAGEGSNDG